MPGACGLQGYLHGFRIAYFAHKDDLGPLAEGRPQAGGEGVEVYAQLALVHGALLVRMRELHRVFQGDDVPGAGFVDAVDERRQRVGLAGARAPGDQDQPVLFRHHVQKGLGQAKLLHAGNARGQPPHDQSQAAALAEDIDAEAALAGQRVGEVARALGRKRLLQARVLANQRQGHGLGEQRRNLAKVRRGDGVLELAVDLGLDGLARGDDDIGHVGVLFQHLAHQAVELRPGHVHCAPPPIFSTLA